ncbi:MAG: HD domain-containing protein [Candidatus Omnitrophica bacterium]|nr:HD domain-containing protein [Candidatus Omnitrophota bacterium]
METKIKNQKINGNINSVSMNQFTLAFKGETEERFLNFYFKHYLSNMRVSMFLGIFVWGLFGLIEIWFYPKEAIWHLLVLRYGVVWPFMVGSVLLTFTKNPKQHVSFAIFIGIMASGIGVISKFALLPSSFAYTPNPSLIIIFLYGYAVMRARFVWASLAGTIIVLFYAAVAVWIKHVPAQEFATNAFLLVMASLIGMYLCYWLELFSRRNFIYAEKLKSHRENLGELVTQRTKELQDTQHEIIHMLGTAAEYRDCETGQHVKRMSYYCALLARAVGAEKKESELLFYASQMHDIGKIGIPDNILLKPGGLEDKEWEIMKSHTTIGAQILQENNSPLLETAQKIALLHHEKWDGSGYPGGLKGEAIPILARIVCLCDVFDALISNRPYKKAWPAQEALKEIGRLKGIFFDPELVDHFKEIFPEILKIGERFSDKKIKTNPPKEETAGDPKSAVTA